METNINSDGSVFTFKRKHWCVFCSLYSIPLKEGVYSSESLEQKISLSSNNPNEILKEIKRNSPSPLVKAFDTRGLLLDEAIAWRKITKDDLKIELEELQMNLYYEIVISQSASDLLQVQNFNRTDQKVIIGKHSAINPNSRLGGLLTRFFTASKFFVGYSIPLILPFAIFKQDLILPVLALFGINLLLAALTWPLVRLRSWIKGIFLAMITGFSYTTIAYFYFPRFYQTGLSVAAVITGILVGLLLECTDRVSKNQDSF